MTAALAEKGSVAAWESIWRAAGPGLGSAIVRDAVARGDDVACVAGLLRSAFGPDPAAAALAEEGGRASNRAADAPSLAGWSSVGGASTEPSDCAPSSASAAEPAPAREPVPYNEFPDGF